MFVNRRKADPAFCWYDSYYGGLTPCKLESVHKAESGMLRIRARVLRKTRVHAKGDIVEGFAHHFRPGGYVYRPRGGYFPHLVAYDWTPLCKELSDGKGHESRETGERCEVAS